MSDFSKIGSFAKVRRGASPRPIGDPKYFGGEVGWIRISDVTASTKFLKKTVQYVSQLGESLSVRVNKGDLIMSICGTIGRPIIIDFPSCIHDGFVQLYDIKKADTEYLYYILQFHEKDLEGKGQPGTQVNLNTGIVENFEIFYPPLTEQRQIARILSTCDAVIEKTKAAIVKYKAIKQGMLHDLFTRGIDLQTGKLRPKYEDAPEMYKESKLGMVPGEWEVEKLENLCAQKPTYGINAAAVDFTHLLPTYIRITDIDEDGNFAKVGRKCVDSYLSNNYILKKGDIVFARTGATVGKTYLYKETDGILVFAGFLIKVAPNEKVLDSNFLKFLTETPYYLNWVEVMSQRSGQPGINGNEYGGFPIPKPEINEQLSISARLLTIQNKLQSEQNYLQKLQSIKQGLMGDLLSGRKRVKVNDEEITIKN
jgi:type I restriction enzyme S subunit